jgi:energy-coupling factor transport system substrate-specific component
LATSWEALTDSDPVPRSVRGWAAFVGVLAVACGACALVIAWGINLLGFVPFRVLANLILINNFVVAVVLAPFLLAVIYPRVRAGRLLYRDLMQPSSPRGRGRRRVALAAVAVFTIGGLVVGNLLSSGALTLPLLGVAHPSSGTGALEVGVGLLPVIIALFLVAALL